jgi:hypothetical protein
VSSPGSYVLLTTMVAAPDVDGATPKRTTAATAGRMTLCRRMDALLSDGVRAHIDANCSDRERGV